MPSIYSNINYQKGQQAIRDMGMQWESKTNDLQRECQAHLARPYTQAASQSRLDFVFRESNVHKIEKFLVDAAVVGNGDILSASTKKLLLVLSGLHCLMSRQRQKSFLNPFLCKDRIHTLKYSAYFT